MNRTSAIVIAIVVGGGLAGPVPTEASEGFGTLSKDRAVVNRVHPPRVFLAGTRIVVRATAQGDAAMAAAAERLRTLLESELLSADSRLTADSSNAETAIDVAIVDDAGAVRWETRTMQRIVDTGRRDNKGKPILDTQDVQVRFEIVTHSFSAAYKAQDLRGRVNLDADTFTKRFNQEFQEGNGAPDLASLETAAVASCVEFVRARLTPSREQVGVLLPRGSLKDLNNLATAGLWNQYLEALQGMAQHTKPEEEAYRQYAMGLAYEALGYAAETTDETLKYLQQASAYYNQALQANPGEKYFSQPYERRAFNLAAFLRPGAGTGVSTAETFPAPLERVRAALVDYQRIKEFHPSGAADGKGLGGNGSGGQAVLDNAGVIEMVQAGLPQDVILTAIDSTRDTRFDVSAKGLIELAKAKVSRTIIQHIQAKASHP